MISAEERSLYRDVEEAAQDGNGIRSICGFDFHLANGSNSRVDVTWNQGIPLKLDSRDLRPVFSGLEIPTAWTDFIRFEEGGEVNELEKVCKRDIDGVDHPRLTRSPLVRFLEQVYRHQLGRARRY
jgi:hypothetical protein